jgi:regulator of sigma E protease
LEVADVIEYSISDRAVPPLLSGDRIVEVNGVAITSIKQWQRELVRRQKEPLELTVVPNAGNSDGEAESSENTQGSRVAAESQAPITVSVPASRRKVLGLVMELGPIVAVQNDSPAAEAGVKAHDHILSIDGQPIGDPITLPDRLTIESHGKKNVTLRVRRDGKEIDLQAELREVDWIEEAGPMGRVSIPSLGIAYQVTATVARVEADSPASRAGIQKGDVLQSAQLRLPASVLASNPNLRQTPPIPITEDQLNHWPAVVEGLQTHHSRGTVVVEYLRGEERGRAELQAIESTEFFNPERGIVLALDHRVREVSGIGEAARLGLRKTVDSLLMVYRFLQRVSQAQISPKLLGGPVTIARVAGSSAKEGFPALLMFLTMLSANLAVVNFLPIPVLDGGHMVFLIYEGITGKPPSERLFVLLSYLGLAFILSLMIFVLGLDFGFISRR